MVKIMTKNFTKEQVMNAMGEQNLMLDDIWGVEERLDELPVANVVEVVLCLDCKHMRTISGEGWGIDTDLYYCAENEILVSPVGYCSDGKRKDGGESDD